LESKDFVVVNESSKSSKIKDRRYIPSLYELKNSIDRGESSLNCRLNNIENVLNDLEYQNNR